MKIIAPFFCLLLSIFFIGCGSTAESGSPDETMSGFIEAMQKQDFQAAKAYTTARTDQTMDFLEQQIRILKEMNKESDVPALFGNVDFSQVKATCTTEGEKAACECCEEITGNCNTINIIKEGGKWLIDFPKETTGQ